MSGRSQRLRVALAILLAALAGCGSPPSVTRFERDAYPDRLSAWGVVVARGDALVLGRDVLPYDLATPLFSDYAHKLRTVWMPPGATARYSDTDVFDFPVGTIFSKTFFYPRYAGPRDPARAGRVSLAEDPTRDFAGEGLALDNVRLVETRLLVRSQDGWDALAYVWDDAQREAYLKIAGADAKLDAVADDGSTVAVRYLVPTRNECANCHATNHGSRQIRPIGPAARRLNKVYAHYADGAAPQLARWVTTGRLDRAPEDAPADAVWRTGAFDDLEARARAYLDANCGHCHSPTGAADTSGLFLNRATSDWRQLGLCKAPIAAGRGSGGRSFAIVPGRPDASIMTFRLASTEPSVMMPELGRTTVHHAGLELIERWIAQLPGECVRPERSL